MNVLKPHLQTTIWTLLAAGASQREIERVTGIDRKTIRGYQKRFCAAEGIASVIALSTLRDPGFGDRYGLRLTNGVLENLLARAVIVIGKDDKVAYVELVPEIAKEPDYDAALEAAKKAAG